MYFLICNFLFHTRKDFKYYYNKLDNQILLSFQNLQWLTCSGKHSPSSTAIFCGQIWNLMTQLVNTWDSASQLKIAAGRKYRSVFIKELSMVTCLTSLNYNNCRRQVIVSVVRLLGLQQTMSQDSWLVYHICRLQSFPVCVIGMSRIPKIAVESAG